MTLAVVTVSKVLVELSGNPARGEGRPDFPTDCGRGSVPARLFPVAFGTFDHSARRADGFADPAGRRAGRFVLSAPRVSSPCAPSSPRSQGRAALLLPAARPWTTGNTA